MTKYYIWRHEGGKKIKQESEGSFEDEKKAQERADELNNKIDIPVGGFRVHEDD